VQDNARICNVTGHTHTQISFDFRQLTRRHQRILFLQSFATDALVIKSAFMRLCRPVLCAKSHRTPTYKFHSKRDFLRTHLTPPFFRFCFSKRRFWWHCFGISRVFRTSYPVSTAARQLPGQRRKGRRHVFSEDVGAGKLPGEL